MTNFEYSNQIYEIMTSDNRYEQTQKLKALDILQRTESLTKTRNYLEELQKEIIEICKEIDHNEIGKDLINVLDY